MIDSFELVDLAFKKLSLMTPDFVFVDDVDCSREGSLSVDGLA